MAMTITNNPTRPEPQALAGAIEALAARFGNRLITSQAVREQHAHTTTWLPTQPPDAVVMAQETLDVQDVVRICAKHRVPVIAFGTGTSLEGQVNAPAGGVCIDLRDMNKVLEVHADDLDCVIQPGVTRKALNEHLRDQGVFFPIDPGADASLGGMASTRASGTNAVRYGTMRDNVLALKVVRGDGAIINTGTRAKKSSAGYDLTHLFVGAEGTLGIITELTIKLRGIPDTIAAAICLFVRDRPRRLPDRQFWRSSRAFPSRALNCSMPLQVQRLQRLFEIDACPRRRCCCWNSTAAPTTSPSNRRTSGEIATESAVVGDFTWTTKPEERTKLWQARHDAYWSVKALCVPVPAWSRPTSACRSRGWLIASPRPRKT